MSQNPPHSATSSYPPLPPTSPQPPPRNKRKKWPWIVGGIAVLVVAGAISSSNGGSDPASTVNAPNSSQSSSQSTAQDDGGKQVGLNQAARDGKFEFTVTSVTKDDNGKIGSEPFLAEAQGNFWVLTMSVKNVGDSEGQYFAMNQKLKVGSKTYEYSDQQVNLTSGNLWPMSENINPENELKKIYVLFDLPKGAKPSAAELHDSAFSDGVVVKLS